jgi:mRNA interferase RelE/StbE
MPIDVRVAISDSSAMRLIFSPAATRAMTKMPRKEGGGLLAKLQQVAADPMAQHPWAKRLTDQPGFRVCQGDWRAIYRLDHGSDEMIVDKIAKRDEVYR